MVADVDVIIFTDDVTMTLGKIADLLSPLGMIPFMETVMGPYLSRRAKGRFASEGDDAVGAWQPLRSSTIAIRESLGFPAGPINRRTGELEEWVVNGGQDAYPVGPDTTMAFPGRKPAGELLKKVQTAQHGDPLTRTVPRPVLAVSETDLIFLQTQLMMAIESAGRL